MASTTAKINWNTDPIPISTPLSALVPIDNASGHGLQLIATGPPRKPNQPVVIFEAGWGCGAYEFATVMRLLAEMEVVRCFAYNRMGTQESEMRSDFKEELEFFMKAEERKAQEAKSSNGDEAETPKDNISTEKTRDVEKLKDGDEEEAEAPMITAMDCCNELLALLRAAQIPGPYITAAHSWGGLITSQLLALKNPPIPLSANKEQMGLLPNLNDQVVGMIFIDANQEASHDKREMGQFIAVEAMTGSIDQNELLDNESRCVRPGGMSPTEWWQCNDEKSWPQEWNFKKDIIAAGMARGWHESTSTLKTHQILKRVENGFEPALTFRDPVTGMKRGGYVSAICGALALNEAQQLYDEAVKRGYGTDEQRAMVRDFVESAGAPEREMQKGFMKLAWEGRGRFVDAEKSAHYVHRTEPELVAAEIKWVVEQLAKD